MSRNKIKYKYCSIDVAVGVLSLAFMLVMHGAIPFVAMPTLGQAIWTMGFSQSFANGTLFSVYATNFGAPKAAAIAFGLSGAYPAALFIKMGIHPADAYSIINMLWLTVAFWGAWQIAREWKLSPILSALSSVLWLSMPIVWWHADYSMIALGIGLLPFYFWTSLRLFQYDFKSPSRALRIAALYLFTVLLAVFMDGYSFMMFAVGASFIGVYVFFCFSDLRKNLLKFGCPVHIFSFGLAYLLYAAYLGKPQFDAAPLDFFRGWGVDLKFLAIPSQGVHWLWDALGFSLPRSAREQFGDASVWATTFALPVLLIGFVAWWRTRKECLLATGFLVLALFGFYMAMGPSLKIDSTRNEKLIEAGNLSRSMPAELAVAPTGSSFLSENVPGFKNMRASYRWSALGFLGFWLLIVLFLAQVQTTRYRWAVILSVAFLVFSNLPNIRNKLSENIAFRDAFFDIDKTLVEDMKQVIYEGEMVAFLPYRNDFFINYLASRIKIQSYNIGGDKNLFEAKKHWPSTMGQFRMGQVDQGFADRVILLLARGEADAVVLPYIDLLWAAHAWPAPLKFKNEVEPVVAKLRDSSFIEIDEREQYTIVRLAAPFVGQKHSGEIEILLRKVLCIEPECLQYVGKESIPSQVGSHTGSGMQTDGRAGFLMFGPYQQINSGVYTLRVTGRVNANGEKAVVDVAGNRGKKIFARFEGLSLPENSTLAENIVLEEQVTIDETVGDLEVRILVDEQADIFISGYSLRPTATPAAQ